MTASGSREGTTSRDPESRGGMFRALSHRNFRLWVAGLLVSSIGTWMQMTAQDWTVLTVLTDGDAGALAFVVAIQTVPQLLLLPVAGYVTDRIPHRRVLIATQTVMGLVAVTLGVLLVLGVAQYWQVCVLAGVAGATQAFDAPARNTFANALVDAPSLSNAIALGSATFNLARLIGPAVAGVLIGVVGPGWIFLANAATFVAVIIALLLMRQTEFHPVPRDDGSRGRWLGGVRYVAAHPRLIVLMTLVLIVVGFVGTSLNLLIITMATGAFGVGATGFGLLTSCVALGSIGGALFVASRTHLGMRLLLGCAGALGVFLLASAFVPTYGVFAAVMPIVGFALMATMASVNAHVQMMTEPGMRGRVMGIYMTAWMLGAPLGALTLGAIIDSVGPRGGTAVSGSIAVVAALGCGVALRVIARRESRER